MHDMCIFIYLLRFYVSIWTYLSEINLYYNINIIYEHPVDIPRSTLAITNTLFRVMSVK